MRGRATSDPIVLRHDLPARPYRAPACRVSPLNGPPRLSAPAVPNPAPGGFVFLSPSCPAAPAMRRHTPTRLTMSNRVIPCLAKACRVRPSLRQLHLACSSAASPCLPRPTMTRNSMRYHERSAAPAAPSGSRRTLPKPGRATHALPFPAAPRLAFPREKPPCLPSRSGPHR